MKLKRKLMEINSKETSSSRKHKHRKMIINFLQTKNRKHTQKINAKMSQIQQINCNQNEKNLSIVRK